MAMYEKLLAPSASPSRKSCLPHDDLQHHERHLNARNTLGTLLGHGIVPIINENDVVSFTELKFGDNDKLSALVTLAPARRFVDHPYDRGRRAREFWQGECKNPVAD